MYKIVFTKQTLKDVEKLKKSGISTKAKTLVDIIREKYPEELISSTDWCIRSMKKHLWKTG